MVIGGTERAERLPRRRIPHSYGAAGVRRREHAAVRADDGVDRRARLADLERRTSRQRLPQIDRRARHDQQVIGPGAERQASRAAGHRQGGDLPSAGVQHRDRVRASVGDLLAIRARRHRQHLDDGVAAHGRVGIPPSDRDGLREG